MPEPIIIRKSAIAVFRDRKVLWARSHKNPEVFYTLGGTVEAGESDLDCLHREVFEEAATHIEADSLEFLEEFRDAAYGRENTEVHIRLYRGKLTDEPQPSSEIAELRYFDSTVDPKHMTPTGTKILDWLKAHDYIN